MLRLDLPTLVVVLVTLCIAIGSPLALIFGPRRGTGALWHWSLALLALAAASVALVLRGTIPVIASVMVGNALIICTVALMGRAASCLTPLVLDGTNRWFFALLTGPLLGVLYLTVEPIWPRVAYMAAVQAYLIGELAWQLHRARSASGVTPRRSALAFEVLLWTLFAETIFRTVAVLILTPRAPFVGQTLIQVAFLFAIVLVAIGTCVLIWHELDVKDDAIRYVRTTDIDTGLPNQAVFLQRLDGALGAPDPAGTVALMRIRPSLDSREHLDPLEESIVYRNVGLRLSEFIAPDDLLARYGEREFAVFFQRISAVQATEVADHALGSLQLRPVSGERGQYRMEGSAVLTPINASMRSAAETAKLLRDGLDAAREGSARVIFPPQRDIGV